MGDAEVSQQEFTEFEIGWNSIFPESELSDFNHFGKSGDVHDGSQGRGLDNGLSAMDAWNPHAGLAYRPFTRTPRSMPSASS